MNSLPHNYRALVIGASGAIGLAIVDQLRTDPRCSCVATLGRSTTPAVDFGNPYSIVKAAEAPSMQGPWHLIVVATGMLHGATGAPEKRLSDLSVDHLKASIAINIIGPALVMSHFVPLLSRSERSALALLSAKVGSIEDNHLGGWYRYRASKAALNMVIKTASIELARTHPHLVVAALHPGTVHSPLSAPFRGAQIGGPRRMRRMTCSTFSMGCSRRTAVVSGPTMVNACPGEFKRIPAGHAHRWRGPQPSWRRATFRRAAPAKCLPARSGR